MKMKTSVIASLQAFILARPPTAVFALSLVTITITVFIVALYIKDKDLILDSHAVEDWDSFLAHLNNQTSCLNISFQQPSRSALLTRSQPFLSSSFQNATFLPAKINHLMANQSLWSSRNAVKFSGHISLKGWKRSCHHENNVSTEEDESVSITVIVPSTSAESSNTTLSCVYLSIPHFLRPSDSSSRNFSDVLFHSQCQALNNVSELNVGNIFPYDVYHNKSKGDSVCHPQDVVQLSYDVAGYDPKIFLTKNERLEIFSRLFFCGYLLLAIICVLLLTAVLQGRNLLLIQQHTLLPTKETVT